MVRLILLALVLYCISASANALNFTSVFEWTDDFGESYKSIPVEPHYITVYENRLFLSLYKHPGVKSTLASIDIDLNEASTRPFLNPFPAPVQSIFDCTVVQSSRGIEVDILGRLWALDNGERNCPPKLWIYDLVNENEVVLVHEFPSPVVSHERGKRWLLDLVLDQTDDDWFAYTAEYISKRLVVYSLKKNESWSVSVGTELTIKSLALSPIRTKHFLYISGATSVPPVSSINSISVHQLRAGARNVSLTTVATLSSWPNRMTMDENGILYFDNREKSQVATWNTSLTPFKEDNLIYENSAEKYKEWQWPITFTIDAHGRLWLMLWSNTIKFKFLTSDIGAKSYLYDSKADKTKNELHDIGEKKTHLHYLSIFLTCWNVSSVFSFTALLVYWFRKVTTTEERLAKIMAEREQVSAHPLIDGPQTSEPEYAEIAPVPASTSRAHRRR